MRISKQVREMAPWLVAACLFGLAFEARAEQAQATQGSQVHDTLFVQVDTSSPAICMDQIKGLIGAGAELFRANGSALVQLTGPEEYCGAIAENPNEPDEIREQIKTLYVTILGRDADEGGLNWWVDQVKNHGKTVADVEANFRWCHSIPKGQEHHCD